MLSDRSRGRLPLVTSSLVTRLGSRADAPVQIAPRLLPRLLSRLSSSEAAGPQRRLSEALLPPPPSGLLLVFIDRLLEVFTGCQSETVTAMATGRDGE